MKCTLASVVVTVLLSASVLSAEVVLLDTKSDFDLLGRELIESVDFSARSGKSLGTIFSDSITFSSPEAVDPDYVYIFSFAPHRSVSDTGGNTDNDVGPIRVEFSEMVGAVTFETTSANRIATITVYDLSDSMIGQFQTPRANGYIAIVADQAIGAFEIVGGEFSTSTIPHGRDRLALMLISTYGVPEPTAAAVLLVSSAGVLSRRSR